MTKVPRIGRVLDLAGLLLFLGGGATFVWAWLGFQGLPADIPSIEGRSAVSVANGYWRLQNIGAGLMIVGVAVFVIAWWVARPRVEVKAN